MQGLTIVLSRVALLALFVVVAAAWSRARDRTRRDILLNVAVFGLAAWAGFIGWLVPDVARTADHVAMAAALAHPYVLAVLSNHLVVIPRHLRAAIGAGLVLAVPLVLLGPFLPTGLVASFAIAYFLVAETFLAGSILEAATRAGGITRSRLRLAALAPLLAVGAALSWGLTTGSPRIAPLALALVHLLFALAALTTVLGFLPPHALRHVWRLRAMEDHVETSLELPLGDGFRPVADHLMAASIAVTGGTRSLMLLKPTEDELFLLIENGTPTLQALAELPGALGQAWRDGRPVLVDAARGGSEADAAILQATGAKALIIVPFTSPRSRWGLIVVTYSWSPLFPKEDMEMLGLIGRHSAMLLDHGRILEEQGDLIADLRVQADALARSNEELRAFSYAVSHDIRTPMVTHMWLLEELQEILGPACDAGEVRTRFDQMQHNLDGMWALTSDLLELARINLDPEEEEPVDLAEVVERAVQTALETVPRKPVTVHVDTSLFPVVVGERVRYQQLFSNLVGNAVKYGPQEGTVISIDVVRRGSAPMGTLQFRVTDNGPGVAPAYRERIFQVCVRAPDPLGRDIPGTGIGLAIAKKVAHQYEGELFVTEAKGGGACFVFELPMLRLHAPAEPAAGTGPLARAAQIPIDRDTAASAVTDLASATTASRTGAASQC